MKFPDACIPSQTGILSADSLTLIPPLNVVYPGISALNSILAQKIQDAETAAAHEVSTNNPIPDSLHDGEYL